MTVPIIRQRAKAPKLSSSFSTIHVSKANLYEVRTGCKTCRARHLKCDEEKPNCARCRKSGRCCAGYDPPRGEVQTRSLAFVQPKASGSSTPLSAIMPSPSISVMDMDLNQRRAYDFFRSQTVQLLPGNSWLLSWERLALRAGVNEPAVLHAVIALGSLHKSSSPDFEDQGQSLHDFALDQCNKAMTLARQHIANVGPSSTDAAVEVVMLISLLLFCFEIWNGQDTRASLHFRLGLKILYERVKDRHGLKSVHGKHRVKLQLNPQDDMDILLQTFVRLDLDMTIPGRSAPYLLPTVCEKLPSFFVSLENATVYLDGLSASIAEVAQQLHDMALAELYDEGTGSMDTTHTKCLAAVRSRAMDIFSNPTLAHEIQENRDQMRRWMNAFTSVEMTSENELAHMLAQLQAFGLWYEISTLRETDEMTADKWQEQFEYILSVAETYVDRHNKDSTRPGFSLGTSLVGVLFTISWKCRTSTIRRRALCLLKSINLHGLFDNDWICALSQQVIDIEETAAGVGERYHCHDIPQEARVVDLEIFDWETPEFYKWDIGKVVFASYDSNGAVRVAAKSFYVPRTGSPSDMESCVSFSSGSSPEHLEIVADSTYTDLEPRSDLSFPRQMMDGVVT